MTEIEIKLAPASPAQAEAVFADGEIAPHLGPIKCINMHTRYFDTPGGDLAAGLFALRLRQEDGVTICTFKAGKPDGPRLEIEAPANTLEDGIAAILGSGELPPKAAEILQGGGFEEICSVSYVRRTALWSCDWLSFWLCFDSGQCFRGEHSGEINEIELEFASGSIAHLEAIVRHLCHSYGLGVSAVSKLGQAMALNPDKEARL